MDNRKYIGSCKDLYEGAAFPAAVYDRDFEPLWLNKIAREPGFPFKKSGALDDGLKRRVLSELDRTGIAHVALAPYLLCGASATFVKNGTAVLALFDRPREPEAGYTAAADGASGMSEIIRVSVSDITLASAAAESLFNSDDPEAERLFSRVRRSSYRVLRSMQNAALLARYYSGALELKKEPCDVGELVRVICESTQDVCGGRTRINYTGPKTPVKTSLDVRLAERAVLNLLLNSLVFTRDGNRIDVSLEVSGGKVMVTVADRGAGIAPENLAEVCVPYFSCEPADDGGVRPGLGLGLTVASLFAELHNGSLMITSEFGEGTAVALNFEKTECEADASFRATVSSYVTNRFSPLYVELCDVCDIPG